MVWHDCKTDPPKKSGIYLLVYKYKPCENIEWDSAYYNKNDNTWNDSRTFGSSYWHPCFELIKWAEVDLSEVE